MKEKHDYYVYIHKDKDTGEVFYVGKGRRDRASSKTGRSSAWKERSVSGFEVDYLHKDLSECEAIELENKYLRSPFDNWKLVNIQKDCDVHELTYDFLSEYLYYDETSPTCLRWKRWNGQWNHSRRDVGDVAGFRNTNISGSRYKVCIHGKEIMAHRIVVILHGIHLDKRLVVNHIDTNPSNNKISNLEVVTQAENSRRTKMHVGLGLNKSNTSGVTGVRETIQKRYNGLLAYYAHSFWKDIDGNTKQKKIPYKEYGKEKAWEIALNIRKEALEQINKERLEYDIC